ncbi:MAG: glycosyltransferase family 4 protein [Candidatus Micrarchaeota archaeon]|nr:glycosyltransferase family 4 protein [Candidatus Micrarchaeota archaeon]
MDICVLNPYFYPYKGGTEKVLYEIYTRLAKRHNITVITSATMNRNSYGIEDINGIKVVRLKTAYIPGGHLLPLPINLMEGFNAAAAKVDADIYHINNRYLYFPRSVHLLKKAEKKIALTIHNALPKGIDLFTDSAGLLYDVSWGRRLMHTADLITGISRATIDSTVPKDEMRKTHLVYNGVDYDKFSKKRGADPKLVAVKRRLGLKGTVVLANGRLVTQKGQTYLLEAVAELKKELDTELNLLIIGRGPLESRLKREAKARGLNGHFKIINGIDEDTLPYYYNVADVFVMPSLYEPASLAILEALSCELPCIASNVGGLPEMMGDCGLLAMPKSSDDIREKILYVLNNKERARALGRKGRERMKKRHDWNNIAKQYEELFEKTIRY